MNNDKLNQLSSTHYNNMSQYQKNKWLVYVVELIEKNIKDWKSWIIQMGKRKKRGRGRRRVRRGRFLPILGPLIGGLVKSFMG